MNSSFQITKFQAHVCSPKRMAELTDRCFSYAMLERGPVQVGWPASLPASKCASILLLVQHSQKDQSVKCHSSSPTFREHHSAKFNLAKIKIKEQQNEGRDWDLILKTGLSRTCSWTSRATCSTEISKRSYRNRRRSRGRRGDLNRWPRLPSCWPKPRGRSLSQVNLSVLK